MGLRMGYGSKVGELLDAVMFVGLECVLERASEGCQGPEVGALEDTLYILVGAVDVFCSFAKYRYGM